VHNYTAASDLDLGLDLDLGRRAGVGGQGGPGVTCDPRGASGGGGGGGEGGGGVASPAAGPRRGVSPTPWVVGRPRCHYLRPLRPLHPLRNPTRPCARSCPSHDRPRPQCSDLRGRE
jgi:hypothetical protein